VVKIKTEFITVKQDWAMVFGAATGLRIVIQRMERSSVGASKLAPPSVAYPQVRWADDQSLEEG
jgi:hypothetical protein